MTTFVSALFSCYDKYDKSTHNDKPCKAVRKTVEEEHAHWNQFWSLSHGLVLKIRTQFDTHGKMEICMKSSCFDCSYVTNIDVIKKFSTDYLKLNIFTEVVKLVPKEV